MDQTAAVSCTLWREDVRLSYNFALILIFRYFYFFLNYTTTSQLVSVNIIFTRFDLTSRPKTLDSMMAQIQLLQSRELKFQNLTVREWYIYCTCLQGHRNYESWLVQLFTLPVSHADEFLFQVVH